MYARVTTFKGSPEQIEGGIETFREQAPRGCATRPASAGGSRSSTRSRASRSASRSGRTRTPSARQPRAAPASATRSRDRSRRRWVDGRVRGARGRVARPRRVTSRRRRRSVRPSTSVTRTVSPTRAPPSRTGRSRARRRSATGRAAAAAPRPQRRGRRTPPRPRWDGRRRPPDEEPRLDALDHRADDHRDVVPRLGEHEDGEEDRTDEQHDPQPMSRAAPLRSERRLRRLVVHELQVRHLRGVALARADLHDPRGEPPGRSANRQAPRRRACAPRPASGAPRSPAAGPRGRRACRA